MIMEIIILCVDICLQLKRVRRMFSQRFAKGFGSFWIWNIEKGLQRFCANKVACLVVKDYMIVPIVLIYRFCLQKRMPGVLSKLPFPWNIRKVF